MTEDRTPEDRTTAGSPAPTGDAPTGDATGDAAAMPGEATTSTGAFATSQAPPPLAPYVSDATEPHSPLGNQASGAAGAYVPPPVPPPAVQQPAVAWAPAPGPAVAATGQRTVLAAIAGLLLLLGGILGGLAGLAVAIIGSSAVASLGDLIELPELQGGADPATVLGGVVAFLGVIVVVYSLMYLIAGIGLLRNRGWGRVLGMVVGILSGLIWLSALGGADDVAAAGGQDTFLTTLVGFGIHAYIVVALLLFWRNKPSTA